MPPNFIDSSTDCAICLDALSDYPTLTLTCGHVYHLQCLRDQLAHAAPTPSKRLLFSATRCAQCQTPCQHPSLDLSGDAQSAARRRVEQRVDELIREQAAIDGAVPEDGEDLMQYGRRVYAFYVCAQCKRVYFGGNVNCGGEDGEAELEGEERLCIECSPRSGRLCADGRHSASYVWKCRLCCREAKFVCYGGVHLCEGCHMRQEGGGEERLARLTGQECLGAGRCALGGLAPGERHLNGIGVECELLLGCMVCESGGGGLGREERGSPNMVRNASGEEGLQGWVRLSRMSWQVERSELPLRAGVNFVSGYAWCVMAQVVDLGRFVRDPGQALVEVSARYMARSDCPSVFQMKVDLLDGRGTEVAGWDSEVQHAPPGGWEKVRYVFEPTERARLAVVVISGRDERFWAGEYGAKVAEISVRVLFDATVEGNGESVLRGGAFDTPLGVDSDMTRLVLSSRVHRYWFHY